MRIILSIAFSSLILWMVACSSKSNPSQTTLESKSEMADRLAQKAYDTHTVLLNESESCALVVNKRSYKPQQSDRNILFQILSLKDESVILKDEITQGFVYWENDESVLVKKYPGEIDDDQINQFGYRFNVINKTRQAIK